MIVCDSKDMRAKRQVVDVARVVVDPVTRIEGHLRMR